MNRSQEDDFVENLLQGLPKAPPMSKLEIKRFERHVDSLVAAENAGPVRRNWIPLSAVAASVVALVAGIAVLTGGSDVMDGVLPIPSATQTAAPNGSSSENGAANEGSGGSSSGSEPSGDDRATYGDSDSSSSTNNKKSTPVLSNSFEYSSEFQQARSKVLKVAANGGTERLTASQISCSIQLGIEDSLWAIDAGTYLGENIEAFFYGDSKSTLKVKVVSFGCELVAEL